MTDENGEKDKSSLAFQIERQTEDRKDWSSRNMRVHYKNHEDPKKIDYRDGTIQTFNDVGASVAVVQKYQDGILDQLGVDAVIEVDTPNLVLDEPLVFERTTQNMAGFTLTGIPSLDKGKLDPDRSLESVMLLSGGQFQGPLQAGFTPKQEVFAPIGKVIDNRQVRLKITDLRPKPAPDLPPVEPVPMV